MSAYKDLIAAVRKFVGTGGVIAAQNAQEALVYATNRYHMREALVAAEKDLAESNEAKMADQVNEETMMGDNLAERAVNAYLTKRFIWSHDVPADECLTEAREVVRIIDDARIREQTAQIREAMDK